MKNLEDIFTALAKSQFRSQFKLGPKEGQYLQAREFDVIALQARDLIGKRLAPANPANDGRQTPMKNHPVFIAQHATATCCHSCLAKWHGIAKGRPLEPGDKARILALIERWLRDQARAT